MKLRKEIKKVTALICAVAMVTVGLTYTPVRADDEASWISVTNVPYGGTKSKYRLGATTDSSKDGKWYLQVAQNGWNNWGGRYQNADEIEGFTFDNQVYNNRGGVFLWSADLKSEFGLTAGTTYEMSVTITYTEVFKPQNNYVFTEGGSSNMDFSRTVAGGDSVETYVADVIPKGSKDFVLRISYSSIRYETAEVGQFEVTDVTFTEKVPETMAPGYKSVTAEAGEEAVKGVEGLWDYTVIPGDSGEYTWDVTATFGNCNTVDGFKATLSKYCWAGSYWKVTDLKSACQDTDGDALQAGGCYRCTVTISEESNGWKLPADAESTEEPVLLHTPITVNTAGGYTNLPFVTKTCEEDEDLVWTGTVVPSDYPLVLSIGYGNDGGPTGLEGQPGSFTVKSVVFEKTEAETMEENYKSVTAIGAQGATAVEGTEGLWTYSVVPGDNGMTGSAAEYWDVNATFGPCNSVKNFKATMSKYCWTGSYWKVNNLKEACLDTDGNRLKPNSTYRCTITINEESNGYTIPTDVTEEPELLHTPITVGTMGGYANIAATTKTGETNNEDLIWTGEVIPSGQDLTLMIGYGNNGADGGLEGQPGSFTVKDIVFEKIESGTPVGDTISINAPAGDSVQGSCGLWNYTLISGASEQGVLWDVAAQIGPCNTIDGFKADIFAYSWDGSYWSASDLKQVYGLAAGNIYDCTIKVKPLCTEETNMHVCTFGGSMNIVDEDQTGVLGDTLVWEGQVQANISPLQLNIGYGNNSLGTPTGGGIGGFEIVSIEFELAYSFSTACTIGTQKTAGLWKYTVAGNAENNQSSCYCNEDAVIGFEYYHNTYSENGANWSASDLKSIFNLKAGKTYNCSVTIKPLCHDATNIHVGTGGGTTNLADTDKTGTSMAKLTWTGEVVPAKGALTLTIGYGNNTGGEGTGAQIGGFKVVDITFEEKGLTAPKSVAAYNFYATDGGYQLVFVPTYSDALSYNLYIDDGEMPLLNISAADCKQIDSKKNVWTVKNNFDASIFQDYANNAIHNLYLTAADSKGNESEKSKAAPVRITSATARTTVANHPTDISRVYITTNTKTNIDKMSKSESKQDAAISVVSAEPGIIENSAYYGTVKLRGNSTSQAKKKAYNISFNTKQKVMTNAVKGKKWCLLANAYEKTLIRNKLAMDFGRLMGGVATPEEHYVDVYMNGIYKGAYVISEPAENGRAGVSYDEDNDEVLFEYEAERDETGPDGGVAYYRTSRYHVRFVNEEFEDEVNEIYSDGATTAELITNYMKKYNPKFLKWTQTLENFEVALQDTASTDYQEYIDENSFVDMYVINELFKTVDFTFSSVKFYLTYDENGAPTIHAGPLWDFDLSSGNAFLAEVRSYDESPLRGQGNPWFGALMKNPVFANKVKARFEELQPQIQNLYKTNNLGASKITQNYEEVKESRIRNYTTAGWSATTPDSYDAYAARQVWGGYSYSTVAPYNSYTYAQHIEYLRNWLWNRNKHLAAAWGIELPDDEEEMTGEQITEEEPTTVEETTMELTETSYPSSTWTPQNESVWHVKGMRSGSYRGGDTLGGLFAVTVDEYKNADGDLKMESPKISVTPGKEYTITATVNTSRIYSNLRLQVVDGASYLSGGRNTHTVIAKTDISHAANNDTVWTCTYTPTSSEMTVMFVSGWSNPGTITISNVSVTSDEEPETEEAAVEETTTEDTSPEEELKIVSKTLSLSSGISLIFKVNGNLIQNGYSNPKLLVTLDGFETELTEYTVDDNGRYAYEFTKITPDKMNVVVTATLHAFKNGREYVSSEVEYSVTTYCYNMLNKYGETAGYEKLRTLLVDLLNYGVASQNYTGFNTNNPANSALTAKQRSWGTEELGELTNMKNNEYATITNPGVTWKSSGLALQDAVIVRMKFQTDSTDGLIIRVRDDYGSIWDIEPKDFEAVAGTTNQYYVNFKGFNVGRMSECMYFTAYRNGKAAGNTYRYSVESYVYAHHNDDNALGALVVAMMKYGKSAKAFNS